MPELTQIYQKQLDDSQSCPVCQAAMYWIEGEFYQQAINFHQCSHCQHSIYYGENPLQCHCQQCLKTRKQQIQAARFDERKRDWQKKHQRLDNVEFLLDELSLLEKLFLLSLLDAVVDEQRPHEQYIDFSNYYPLQIAPSYQLFKYLKERMIKSYYLLSADTQSEKYFLNLRLQGYREPSILSITHQLRMWFFHDFTQGVPYRNSDEVLDVLRDLLSHDIVNFCQQRCQKIHIQFYANQQFIEYCKTLLTQLAVHQIYFLADKAITYLQQNNLLHSQNKSFINTNHIRKTMSGYRQRGQQQYWETPNLERPADLAFSQMSYLFLYKLLKFEDKALLQPLWKAWQHILPKLRFFTERHCIHCGSKDLLIEHSTLNHVSFSCRRCKQQDHYFIE